MSEYYEIPRLTRLTNIVTMLKSKKILTASDIAKKFDISVRTVYRDIRALEESGIPIMTVEGKGYSIMEDYTLPPLMFTEAEANALVTAEHLINNTRDGSLVKHFQEALTKIKSIFRYGLKEKSERLSDRMFVMSYDTHYKTSNSLSDIQSAIIDRTLTEIEYQKPDEIETQTRIIEPQALYYSSGNWILIAWCHLRNDYRSFRIDRIINIKFCESKFNDRGFDLKNYFSFYF